MESEKRTGAAGCFKGGCLGCLVVVGLMVVIPVVLMVVALALGPAEELPERTELTQELPPLAGLPAEAPEPGAGAEAPPPGVGPEAFDGRELPTLPLGQEPIEVVLDLSKGSFIIEPGPAGEPLRVEADYDAGSFELEERFDPERGRYELSFDSRGGWLSMMRRRDGPPGRVRLIVPRGYPLTVRGAITMGESRVDLGGLWLKSTDLRFGAGSHRLAFSEALAEPMERLRVNGSFGEVEIDSAGNASPREVEVDHSMGSLTLDLRGQWRGDSTVDVECGFGECSVRRPETARLVVEHARVALGDRWDRGSGRLSELPADAPTVRLSVSATAGELRID